MGKQQQVGAPMPVGPVPYGPDLIVAEGGSFDEDDGIRVVLRGTDLIVLGAFDGTEVMLGIDIHLVLEAIQTYTKTHES